MKQLALALVLAFVSVGAGCGAAATQVEMKGRDTELARIAGEWHGSYTGTDSGRTGPVSFSLQLGRHTADGTVLMGGETPLKISFVAIDGGQISGKIAPYTEPTCACQVETEFIGTVSGDAIIGSFVTRSLEANVEQRGEWSVTRSST
jgi:hypothetical protein